MDAGPWFFGRQIHRQVPCFFPLVGKKSMANKNMVFFWDAQGTWNPLRGNLEFWGRFKVHCVECLPENSRGNDSQVEKRSIYDHIVWSEVKATNLSGIISGLGKPQIFGAPGRLNFGCVSTRPRSLNELLAWEILLTKNELIHQRHHAVDWTRNRGSLIGVHHKDLVTWENQA